MTWPEHTTSSRGDILGTLTEAACLLLYVREGRARMPEVLTWSSPRRSRHDATGRAADRPLVHRRRAVDAGRRSAGCEADRKTGGQGSREREEGAARHQQCVRG